MLAASLACQRDRVRSIVILLPASLLVACADAPAHGLQGSTDGGPSTGTGEATTAADGTSGGVVEGSSGSDGGTAADSSGGDASTGDAGLPPVEPPPSEVVVLPVGTVAELENALMIATPGSVIEIEAGADLDLSGKSGLVIPPQVTLSGGGGNGGAGGAILRTNTQDTPSLFDAGGDGVRVTGVRLLGPDQDIGASAYGEPLCRAVRAVHADGLRVDHSELSGWSHAAILLDYAVRARVDHDAIHHNRRTGLGYGTVLVHEADGIFEYNEYNANRHSIAGTGRLGISYEARHNHIGATRNGHALDMHGQDEADGDGSPWAGDVIDIHHNTFLGTEQGIVIRGKPKVGAYIDDNCFGQSQGAGTAIIQRYFFGNLFVGSNSYSQASGNCHAGSSPSKATRGDINGDQIADVVTLVDGTVYPFLGAPDGVLLPAPPSFGGTMPTAIFGGPGHLVIDVADVDGDLLADLVTAYDDGSAYVYRGRPGGTFGSGVSSFAGTYPVSLTDASSWEPIAVADVNGDGRGDLVSVRDGSVFVHPGLADGRFGGSSSSFAGTFDSASIDGEGHFSIDVADVTGDGRADLVTLRTSGSAYVFPGKPDGTFGSAVESFAGTMNPALPDGEGFEPVGLGDVNGDGKADLVTLNTNGTAYVYLGTTTGVFGTRVESFAGTMPTSLFDGEGFDVLAPLDVTGDGRADLVTVHPSQVLYVYPGKADGSFAGSVASIDGFRTTRAGDHSYEAVQVKSVRRRLACAIDGCAPV